MRNIWKGVISFGLVSIPIKLYTATEAKDVRFNFLHKECKSPIKYEKVCPVCQKELSSEDLVRGYEYEKGRYVIIQEEDLEALQASIEAAQKEKKPKSKKSKPATTQRKKVKIEA